MTRKIKPIVAATVLLASLAAQTGFVTKAYALEAVPGSITFQGQPRTKLQKSPVGSTFTHSFRTDAGHYEETYRLDKDRSLELVSRRRINNR